MALRELDGKIGGKISDFEIIGDHPPYIEYMPGAIAVDSVASPKGLEKAVNEKLEQHPDVLKEARRLGKDVIGLVSSHGKEIFIGVGVASLAIGAATGAVVIYRHRRRQ